MTHITHSSLLLFTLLSTVLGSAWALPEDREQPIHISSDSAVLDDNEGISTYTGNVEIVQGSIRLQADKVTIYSKDSTVTQVVATGRPAHFQQRPDMEKSVMHAYGETINYQLSDELITLTENAKLEDSENSFSGNKIQYDIKTQRIMASAGTQSENNDQRVEMIIQPKQNTTTEPAGESSTQ